MNRTRIGGLAAGMFVVGLLTGMAGTAVAREEVQPADCAADMTEHMAGQDMTAMMSMMGGPMMGGPRASMGPDMMDSGDPGIPGPRHELHHRQVLPETAE